MLLNCGVGEDSWESLGLQGDPTSPSRKEISPEYWLEGLRLKLQYFGHLMQRTDSFEKIMMLAKIEGRRRRGRQRMRWLDGITHSMDEFGWIPGVGDGQGGLACCGSWGHKESDTTERLSWTVEACQAQLETKLWTQNNNCKTTTISQGSISAC